MKNYIYWNDKEFSFFNSTKEEVSDKVVNTFDMRYNPCYMPITEYKEDSFKVENHPIALGLKKHFNLAWVGNNSMFFRKKYS